MHLRADRFEKKSRLLDQRILLEQLLQQQKDAVASANSFLSKAQTVLEEEIKRESISNISARAIFMLDKLQKELYQRQISKVEVVFRRSINMLMRKERFIDDIRIDDSFNIFVFRNKEFDGKTFKDIVATNTEEQFVSMFGNIALSCINKK